MPASAITLATNTGTSTSVNSSSATPASMREISSNSSVNRRRCSTWSPSTSTANLVRSFISERRARLTADSIAVSGVRNS